MEDKEVNEAKNVQGVILETLAKNNVIAIASTGGKYSPWILQAYFASKDMELYLFLEKSGKTHQNISVNDNIAISISENDAMKDFLQGYGKIEIMPDDKDDMVRQMLVSKMPWYQTYTPVSPVRIKVVKFFISSFSRGWFPAKELENA